MKSICSWAVCVLGAFATLHTSPDRELSDPVFGEMKPWDNSIDDLTKALVCVCKQVIRTKVQPSPDNNTSPVVNECADKYCKMAAHNPKTFGCSLDGNLFGSAGEIERCIVEVHPEDCFINYPDYSDRAKTLAYFKAIAACVPPKPSVVASQ